MPASCAFRVSVGTFLTAIVAVSFFYRIFNVDDADAIVTSTFLLRYGRHWFSPLLGFIRIFVVMREKMIDHDRQDAVHAGIGHRVEHMLTPSF